MKETPRQQMSRSRQADLVFPVDLVCLVYLVWDSFNQMNEMDQMNQTRPFLGWRAIGQGRIRLRGFRGRGRSYHRLLLEMVGNLGTEQQERSGVVDP